MAYPPDPVEITEDTTGETNVTGEPMKLSIVGCARCDGDGHDDLYFTPLTHPMSTGHSHWAMCPTINEPIMLIIMTSPMPETLLLTGQYLDRLKNSIEENDYCFLCDCHPSHEHAKDCPLNTETVTVPRHHHPMIPPIQSLPNQLLEVRPRMTDPLQDLDAIERRKDSRRYWT